MNINITPVRYFSEVRLKSMKNYDLIPVSPDVLSKLSEDRDKEVWLLTQKKKAYVEVVTQCGADLL